MNMMVMFTSFAARLNILMVSKELELLGMTPRHCNSKAGKSSMLLMILKTVLEDKLLLASMKAKLLF